MKEEAIQLLERIRAGLREADVRAREQRASIETIVSETWSCVLGSEEAPATTLSSTCDGVESPDEHPASKIPSTLGTNANTLVG